MKSAATAIAVEEFTLGEKMIDAVLEVGSRIYPAESWSPESQVMSVDGQGAVSITSVELTMIRGDDLEWRAPTPIELDQFPDAFESWLGQNKFDGFSHEEWLKERIREEA